MRNIDNLQSIVIVKGSEGYEATIRFADPRYDFILHRSSRTTIYDHLERKLGNRPRHQQPRKHNRITFDHASGKLLQAIKEAS